MQMATDYVSKAFTFIILLMLPFMGSPKGHPGQSTAPPNHAAAPLLLTRVAAQQEQEKGLSSTCV